MLTDSKPDFGCKLCNGMGYVIEGEVRRSCDCVLISHIKKYLTPTYANSPYTLNNFNGFENSCIFDGCSRSHFKSIVKSFLLTHRLEVTHMSVTPFDIIEAYFSLKESDEFKDMISTDLLIIYFCTDPRNKLYGEAIITILDKRLIENKWSWVFCKESFDSKWFRDNYTSQLSDYLRDNFLRIEGINSISFNRGLKK